MHASIKDFYGSSYWNNIDALCIMESQPCDMRNALCDMRAALCNMSVYEYAMKISLYITGAQ